VQLTQDGWKQGGHRVTLRETQLAKKEKKGKAPDDATNASISPASEPAVTPGGEKGWKLEELKSHGTKDWCTLRNGGGRDLKAGKASKGKARDRRQRKFGEEGF